MPTATNKDDVRGRSGYNRSAIASTRRAERFGDRVPETTAGQGVAVELMLVGIGLVGVLTATIASFFVSEEGEDMAVAVQSIQDQLNRLEETITSLATERTSDELNTGNLANFGSR